MNYKDLLMDAIGAACLFISFYGLLWLPLLWGGY